MMYFELILYIFKISPTEIGVCFFIFFPLILNVDIHHLFILFYKVEEG